MNAVQEAEKLLHEMTRAEKVQLLQRIVQDVRMESPRDEEIRENRMGLSYCLGGRGAV